MVTAASADDLQKPCILAAAQYLPRITGIDIKESRTKPLPAEIKRQLDQSLYHTVVEIDAKAAGIDETFRFVCTAGATGRPLITPMS